MFRRQTNEGVITTDRPRVTTLRYRVLGEDLLKVLERAASDERFSARLNQRGSRALQGYNLTSQERAAILSGDVRWIETHVGKLTAHQRTWLDRRLQREAW